MASSGPDSRGEGENHGTAGGDGLGRSVGEQSPASENHDGEQTSRAAKFFIVGVGASAGGLEALTAFLKGLALDSMAVVIVQHLAPKHESVLPALLSRASAAKVMAVADGMPVEPGGIYVIPPNADLAILQGRLHLMPPPVVRRTARTCRSTTSSARSPRTRDPAPSGSCSRAPAPTERSASKQSRRRAASPSPRIPLRPTTTACHGARSTAAGPTSRWRRKASPMSCSGFARTLTSPASDRARRRLRRASGNSSC